MHSPEVLAFSIKRPWPEVRKQPHRRNAPRWQSVWHRRDDGSHFLTPFAYVAGRELYFPSAIDIWHMEPGGHDSLTICKNKVVDSDGKFVRWSHAWKYHFWHWHITVVFLYAWRRQLLTRCNVCGGRSTKKNPVNHSDSWYPPKTPFWRGETHLHHGGCTSEAERRP